MKERREEEGLNNDRRGKKTGQCRELEGAQGSGGIAADEAMVH